MWIIIALKSYALCCQPNQTKRKLLVGKKYSIFLYVESLMVVIYLNFPYRSTLVLLARIQPNWDGVQILNVLSSNN